MPGLRVHWLVSTGLISASSIYTIPCSQERQTLRIAPRLPPCTLCRLSGLRPDPYPSLSRAILPVHYPSPCRVPTRR
ncbi:hypothetical protein FA13DRAFT_1725596 [Coprinellus micaceus]|uniref:Secreted protein n=1 Tax=Coprinellus micaceus TaxID=71717 RepID=A0A4Y7TUU8_COPMI|nr:hypothetical protein FA13DRAFT_1725596 [Coprinellus micaceus]